MLSVLWGPGFATKRQLDLLLARTSLEGGSLFCIKNDSEERLADFLSGGLFGGKVCLVGEFLLESPHYEAEIRELLIRLAASEHFIFLRERNLSDEWQEVFKNTGADVRECKNPSPAMLLKFSETEAAKLGLRLSESELLLAIEEEGGDPEAVFRRLERLSLEGGGPRKKKTLPEPNFFTFADMAAGKNKYRAMQLLHSYVRDGFGAEEAFWKLWWKVKTLRMVDSGGPQAKLHPFVQKRAREDLKNYTSQELRGLSYGLMDLFSEVRRGEENFEEGLEKILLQL